MSTVHQDADDSPPCIAPVPRSGIHRVFGALSFPVASDAELVAAHFGGLIIGGEVPESHPGGVTPSTVTNTASSAGLAEETIAEMGEYIAEARRLIALGRHDEARFELSQVARLTQEARSWLE
jgi:hypothetical protein